MDGNSRIKMEVDKVDMSLDDIIKLDKRQNSRGRGRGQRSRGQGTGAGRGVGRGTGAGRGGGRGKGAGRGIGRGTGAGRGIGRGTGGGRGVGRGGANRRGGSYQTSRGGLNRTGGGFQKTRGGAVKGRGADHFSQLDKSFSGRGRRGRGGTPTLNRTQSPGKDGGRIKSATFVRGRGGLRGRRGQAGTLRGRGLGKLRGGLQSTTQLQAVGLTSLNRRRQLAVQSLQKAKQTLAQIDAQQRQKSSRSLIVNKKRGLQVSNMSLNKTSPRGRGRGRARGGLTRYSSTMSINSVASTKPLGRGRGRGLERFGSTVSLSSVGSQKKRGWRQNVTADDSMITVSIQNSAKKQRPRKNMLNRYSLNDTDPELAAQIRNLKPATSQQYNFKKTVFAQATTSTSLNDRFSSGDKPKSSVLDAQGRKVFF